MKPIAPTFRSPVAAVPPPQDVAARATPAARQASPPGLSPGPGAASAPAPRARLPGRVSSTRDDLPRGPFEVHRFPTTGSIPIASTRELRAMAEALRTQNAPTYGHLTVDQVVDQLLVPGKELVLLTPPEEAAAAGRRAMVALTPRHFETREGHPPAGSYAYVSQLISNGDAGGIRGGGRAILDLAKEYVARAGGELKGLRLYTDTDKGAAFYEKNGFQVYEKEALGDVTRRHMVWMAPTQAPST